MRRMVKPHFRISVGLPVVVVAAFALASCGLDLFGPGGPGVIRVTLASPYGPDGAAVLELTGGVGPSIVASELGDTFYEHGGGTTRVVVILHEPGQIEFTVRVEDVGARPSVTLVQVADGANRLRTSLSDYEVDLEQLEDMTSSRQRRLP
jgi:hypothetical protein